MAEQDRLLILDGLLKVCAEWKLELEGNYDRGAQQKKSLPNLFTHEVNKPSLSCPQIHLPLLRP